MPVHVLRDGLDPDSQLPTNLTRVSISSISLRTDYSNNTVKGKVVQKGPLVSLAQDKFILKTVIQEEDSQGSHNVSINVVLLGSLAKDFSQSVKQGDAVACSGFSVGKSPTAHKDKLHPCNLLLSGDHACVYVSRPSPPPDPPRGLKRSSAEVSRLAKFAKTSYTGLGELKPGAVVNVYGVVIFFKQPFKSRGTDYCSSLKITDQSHMKVGCTVFREKLDDHPKIFRVGDIIRMHRVKTHFFNDSITLVNTFGFSVVTFDGSVDQPVEPRTSSKTCTLDPGDTRTVQGLRLWASSQNLLPALPTIPLCDVQPRAYFDLTCQLLAKAPVDSTCTLLRVWDGTRCAHSLLKVSVEPDVTEGPAWFPAHKERLIANILVYDNHVESSKQLKPGDFLRIYNLRAIAGLDQQTDRQADPQTDRQAEPQTDRQADQQTDRQAEQQQAEPLAFYLHGGTAYGRGIRVLPPDSTDVQDMKRVLDSIPGSEELNDSEFVDVWATPPESPEPAAVEGSTECVSERSCDHGIEPTPLCELKTTTDPGSARHVRVQLRSYEPKRLHQALKLYCSKCSTMQDVPDEEQVSSVFSAAANSPCDPAGPSWSLSGQLDVPGRSGALSVHLSTQLLSEGKTTQLLFLEGPTLEETCCLAAGFQNIVPVTLSGGHMTLLDLSAPFLFRGRRRYYGCPHCSKPEVNEPCAEGVDLIDEKIIAGALGIELLQFVLTMKFELRDATGTLDVYLWRDAEKFLGVSAEDAAANQDAQNRIRQKMDSLCPPGGSTDRPWLNLCLSPCPSLDGEHNEACYQILNSTSTKPTSTRSDPEPA